jgi:DNA-binding CsgD family transcriptional regulator
LPKIIDDIYEAAVIPGLWTRTLAQVSRIADAEGGVLFAQSPTEMRHVCSPAISTIVEKWLSDGWVARDVRIDRLRLTADAEPRFLTDFDVLTREEMDRSTFYTEFLRKEGLGWGAGTLIRSPTADAILLSVERAYKKGPVEPQAIARLDALRPHLARAAMLSARASLERARSSVIALASVGLPAAVLTPTRKAIAANALMEKLAPNIRIGAGDLMSFDNSTAHALFDAALKAPAGDAASRSCSFPLPSKGGSLPAVAHLLPLTGHGRDIFTGAAWLVYITILSRHATLPNAILQALFDLTPAEARVAGLIGSGRSVTETSLQLDVQANTVRTHLKSIYAKTGARRQADIVDIVVARSPPDATS